MRTHRDSAMRAKDEERNIKHVATSRERLKTVGAPHATQEEGSCVNHPAADPFLATNPFALHKAR